jgi:hypothetical protein
LDGLETLFYPMVWFETYTELDDETASLMKFLGIAPKLGTIIGSIMIGLGCLTASIAFFSIWRSRNNKSPEKKYKKRYV